MNIERRQRAPKTGPFAFFPPRMAFERNNVSSTVNPRKVRKLLQRLSHQSQVFVAILVWSFDPPAKLAQWQPTPKRFLTLNQHAESLQADRRCRNRAQGSISQPSASIQPQSSHQGPAESQAAPPSDIKVPSSSVRPSRGRPQTAKRPQKDTSPSSVSNSSLNPKPAHKKTRSGQALAGQACSEIPQTDHAPSIS